MAKVETVGVRARDGHGYAERAGASLTVSLPVLNCTPPAR